MRRLLVLCAVAWAEPKPRGNTSSAPKPYEGKGSLGWWNLGHGVGCPFHEPGSGSFVGADGARRTCARLQTSAPDVRRRACGAAAAAAACPNACVACCDGAALVGGGAAGAACAAVGREFAAAAAAAATLESFCDCLLYTSPSPRDKRQSRMPSSA
mgnify:CR=1 FL=1